MKNKKRILIPTDFTINALQIVIDFLIINATEDNLTQYEILLVHGRASSSSATELLGISTEDILNEAYTNDFLTACQIIKHRFENQLVEIYSDLILSNNNNYIRNYLISKKIHEVYIPIDYNFNKPFKSSFCLKEPLSKNSKHLGILISENKQYYKQVDKTNPQDNIENIFFRKEVENAIC